MRKLATAVILLAGYAALIETTDAACGGGGGAGGRIGGFIKKIGGRILHPFKGGSMAMSSGYNSMGMSGGMMFSDDRDDAEAPTGEFISNDNIQDCCDNNAPGLRILVAPKDCAEGQEMMFVPATVPITRERHVVRRNGVEVHRVRVLGHRTVMVAVPPTQQKPPMDKAPKAKPPEQAPKPAPLPKQGNLQHEFVHNCPGLPTPDSILAAGRDTRDLGCPAESCNSPGLTLPAEAPPAADEKTAEEEQPAKAQPVQEQIARGRMIRRGGNGGMRSGGGRGCSS